MAEDKIKIKKEHFISHKTSNISKEYTLGKKIGKGSFGQVRLAIHKATKQVRAVKILKKSNIDMQNLYDEVTILSKISHPSIMQIYEIFEDNLNVYIISEYCQGGELFEIITQKGYLSEREACIIMKQLMSAICYCHENRIVHRDLKPENILIDKLEDLKIKIIDWGCAKRIKKNEKLNQIEGSSYYIAPEVIRGEYNEKCDIWACGIIFYILLCGYPPFNGDNDEEIFASTLKGEFVFPEEEWILVSEEAKNLIKKMLTMNTEQRISALDSLQDIWFKNNETKPESDHNLAKSTLSNMIKFKKNRKLEKATVAFITTQLILKDERLELEKQFKEWDINGDGVLSKNEIIKGYKKVYNHVDENEIENMIKSIDLDGNGVIDYHEFLVCTLHRDKILRTDNLELCFQAFDLDNSGKISLDEIVALFKKGNKKKYLDAFKKMISEADTNEDGEISLEELKDIMIKFFN